jgi:hypothetical protein
MDPEVNEILEFEGLLQPPTQKDAETIVVQAQRAFANREFLIGNNADPKKIPPEYTAEDKDEALWTIAEMRATGKIVEPTTPGAARVLERLLKKFDYNLPNSSNQMRQYLVYKLFDWAENEDPKVSLKAVEMLGKVSEIGLFNTKIEIATSEMPTQELESELNKILKTYSLGEIKAIEVKAVETFEEKKPKRKKRNVE